MLVGDCRNLLDYYQSGVPALVTVICDTSVNVVYAIHGYVVRVDSNPRLFLHRFQTFLINCSSYLVSQNNQTLFFPLN
jgi:hypothetical protein